RRIGQRHRSGASHLARPTRLQEVLRGAVRGRRHPQRVPVDKRVYRLYRDAGLGLRRKRPKRRRAAMARTLRPTVSRPAERWTMDFMSDALANGQRLRVLTVLDAYTRECLALEAAVHFRGQDVARVLTEIGLRRGLPTVINCDNGTEFTSRAGP